MSTKDITDRHVCEAYAEVDAGRKHVKLGQLFGDILGGTPLRRVEFADAILLRKTGQPEKVVNRAMERAHRHGLIEYGVSLRSGWLTEEGQRLLAADNAGA
jgi:hypothetical protein